MVGPPERELNSERCENDDFPLFSPEVRNSQQLRSAAVTM